MPESDTINLDGPVTNPSRRSSSSIGLVVLVVLALAFVFALTWWRTELGVTLNAGLLPLIGSVIALGVVVSVGLLIARGQRLLLAGAIVVTAIGCVVIMALSLSGVIRDDPRTREEFMRLARG